jgi:hypothetical protein
VLVLERKREGSIFRILQLKCWRPIVRAERIMKHNRRNAFREMLVENI